MKVIIVKNAEEGARKAADIIEKIVRENPACTLGLATGSSPVGMYRELARRCREEGIHTNADTCGFGTEEAVRKVMACADLCYFDIKHMDPAKHEAYTGVRNETILRNLELTLSLGVKTVIRVPLIPEHNADEAQLSALADYVKGLGPGVDHVCFLPYHVYGESKYKMIGREYPLKELRKLTEEEMQRAVAITESRGLRCTLSKH